MKNETILNFLKKGSLITLLTALVCMNLYAAGLNEASSMNNFDEAPVQVPQQKITITGTVTGNGEALVGVNVVLKRTKNGVITDLNGNYSIQVDNQNEVLTFSFLGFETEEHTVGNKTILDVDMKETTHQIDEVMVVAYGVAKKSTFTGSTSVVNSDQIEKISGSGFAETLQGMSAGVNVINNEGNPGGDTYIQIRGIGSISASSNPLYVLDGMPYDGKLTSISPSDIESMTVLKDAAAASLYGSRAANGVIVITTKKGKAGKPVVNFKAAWGTSDNAVANPTKADPYQQLTNTWEGIYNDQFYKYGSSDADARMIASRDVVGKIIMATNDSHGNPIYVSPFKYVPGQQYVLESGQVNPNLEMVWNPKDYDWYGAVFSKKLRQDYSADVSGMTSDGKTNYFFSTNYIDDKGYGLKEYFKRYSFRANISTQATDWLKMGGNIAYSNSKQNNSGFNRALVFCSTMASPWLRNADNTDWVYSEKTGVRMFDFGTYASNFFGIQPLNNSGDYWNNPNDYSFDNVMANMVSSRFFAEIKLPYNLQFRSNLSIDDNITEHFTYDSAVHGGDQLAPYGVTVTTNGGGASRENNHLNSITWNNLLTFDKKIGDHSINALIGQELYSFNQYYNYGYGDGIMQLGQFELDSTTKDWYVDSFRNRYALLSFLGKIDYGFKDKYYISGSFREDGSSKFAKNNRWGLFFSVGGSWRISMEKFMSNLNWMDNLLLRASYGTSGNDKLTDENGSPIYYAYQATYAADNMYGNPGLQLETLPTPDLKWEKNAQFNVAADFKVFKKVYGTLEYYFRQSKDLLYRKLLSPSAQSGDATNINTNLGTIENRGLEITLGVNLFQNRNFKWNIDANWSSLNNKITYLPDGEYLYADRTATYKVAEGHSLYEFFMPSNAGVDPQTGDALFWIKDSNGNRVKTNDFSLVTTDDYDWKGSALPKGYGSITNSFGYKGFDLSFMLYYSYGAKLFDYVYMERVTLRRGVGVIQDLVKDRWQKPGDIAYFPRWSDDDYASTRRSTDFWLFDNSYVRLRNLTFGYTLPKSILHKANLSNLRIYVSGDNLLTFGGAKNRYTDPETGVSGNNYNGNSLTDNGYPSSRRVFMSGLQITF